MQGVTLSAVASAKKKLLLDGSVVTITVSLWKSWILSASWDVSGGDIHLTRIYMSSDSVKKKQRNHRCIQLPAVDCAIT